MRTESAGRPADPPTRRMRLIFRSPLAFYPLTASPSFISLSGVDRASLTTLNFDSAWEWNGSGKERKERKEEERIEKENDAKVNRKNCEIAASEDERWINSQTKYILFLSLRSFSYCLWITMDDTTVGERRPFHASLAGKLVSALKRGYFSIPVHFGM